MKKVGILLHETSIINFSFVWKLIKRYFVFTIVIPAIVFTAFGYKYYTQNNIFLVKLGFQNVAATGGGSATSALFESLGEKSSTLNPNEIIAVGRNVDFIHHLASSVREHEQFRKLNFNTYNSKNIKTFKQIFGTCNEEKACEVKKVSGILKGMFSINSDRFLETRFSIDVRNIEKNTALVIVKEIAKVFETRRLKTQQQFINDQIRITRELTDAKKSELDQLGVEQVAEDIKQKEVLLEGITTQLRQYQSTYLRLQEQMTSAETILSQTKETLNRNVDFKKLGKSRRVKVLKSQLEKLREDIASVELAGSSFSSNNSKVLDRLKKNLRKKEKEYKNIIKSSRGVSSLDTLLESKNKSTSFSEFDFAVMKKKFKEAKRRYQDLKKEKEKIIHARSELEVKFEQMAPSIEYFKLLKEKLVQLELASSTVVSDLSFDRKVSSVQRYKKLSKTKVLMASMSVSGFITLICLILFYLFDNRIYDEEELANNFSDLEIIGNTPDFQ